jgi:hypothetical protein
MQQVDVVDPRLAAGRGDEFRASTQRARADELADLAAADGEDFRCAAALPVQRMPPCLYAPVPACSAQQVSSSPWCCRQAQPCRHLTEACMLLPSPLPRLMAFIRLPLNRWYDENVDLEETECASLEVAIPQSNVGYRLLQRLGWRPGGGLGREQQGAPACLLACAAPAACLCVLLARCQGRKLLAKSAVL